MTTDSDGTIAGAVLRGQASLRHLRAGGGLREAAEALIAAASGSGSALLFPASDSAGVLVGAAVILGDGSVAAIGSGDSVVGCKVLVVDAVAVSGLFVRSAVETLRQGGADWVGVFVWAVESPPGSAGSGWGDVDLVVLPTAV